MRKHGTIVIVAVLVLAGSAAAALWPRRAPSIAPPVVPAATAPAALPAPLPQKPLHLPAPARTKGIYLTAWTAGSAKRMQELMPLIRSKGLNTVVIDVKDYSGYLSYPIANPLAIEVGANKQPRLRSPEALIASLHDAGVYVIARITVFEDPLLAAGKPQWMLRDPKTGGIWHDAHGMAWVDPATEQVWDYVAAIAADAYARGFDEANFDYIRFPSSAVASAAEEPKHETIRRFFAGLRQRLPDQVISADLFGLTTTAKNDLGIGQKIEDAYPYFDYLSPMVYPSHYSPGFAGWEDPAEHPYEVVSRAMRDAAARHPERGARIRPWLQAFDLGARYDKAFIDVQISASSEAFAKKPEAYAGYLLWNPASRYRDL